MNLTSLLLIVLFAIGNFQISLTALIVLIIIGLIVIVLIKLFLILIPAIIVAAIVYFVTGGDLLWTGVAFLVVALLSLIRKI